MSPALAIGPSNYAGQATAQARAAASNLPAQMWPFSGVPLYGGGFHFEVDKLLGRVGFRALVAWRWRTGCLFDGVTYVALDGSMSFARWDRAVHFQSDARRLAEMGYWMTLTTHDSDVRDPLVHMARDQWSYLTVGNERWRSSLVCRIELNRSFAASCGWPVLHSIPGMGSDPPSSTWLPVVVNAKAWTSDAPLLEREKPFVMHVSSQRKPSIKGTQFIDPVLRRFHDEDAVEYVVPSGLSHAQLRELVRSCDVVVDQVIFGFYGAAVVEVMAAGQAYVGRMNEAVRDRLPESSYLPKATPDDLYKAVASIRDRRDELHTRAAENRVFAEKWRDGRVLTERLTPFLGVG